MVNYRLEAKRLPPNANRSQMVAAIMSMVKAFKRGCEEVGIPHEFKEHQFFIRKTDKKRRKKMAKLRGELKSNEFPVQETFNYI